MIPDFGESDVLHLNLPFKYILSTELKNGRWPVWTPYLAGGFPILAEGQIGTFYLPNLVFFRFLPFIWAYNLNLAVSYLLAAIGIYLFTRKLGLSAVASFFAAFIFTFSGFLAVHLNHFNLIQAASLLPFIFLSVLCLWKQPSFKYAILFAFILSQQIFTGHFYIVFITLVGVLMFLTGNILFNKTNFARRKILFFSFSFFAAFAFSAIQLLPTIELWQLSARQGGLDFNTVTDYPYPLKHLVTFITPFYFGKPADGTYPEFSFDWGIFWENTAYVGIIPLILAAVSLFFFKEKLVKTFLFILFASLLLVLGRNSPFYFIFTIFPFNLFRVPSKFLLLITFSISILAAISFENIKSQIHAIARICDKRKICNLILLGFFLFLLVDEYGFSYNYPPATPAKWWTDDAEITKLIPENSKIVSVAAPSLWNKVFKKDGWQDFAPYFYFKNSLYPNYNVFSSLPAADINTGGLVPRRLSLFTSNLRNIEIDEEKKEASVSSTVANSLSLAAVDFLISPYKINHRDFIIKNTILPPIPLKLAPFFLYENKSTLSRSYLIYQSIKVETLEEFQNYLSDENFVKPPKVLVEDEKVNLNSPANTIKPAEIVSETPTEITLLAESEIPAILVLTDTNYPGWRAYIDGIPTKIYDVNLVQKSVYFPPGKHQVKFVFKSETFERGKKITIFSGLIISAAAFLSALTSPRKSSRTRRLS